MGIKLFISLVAELDMAATSDEAYEELRLILEKQYGQAFNIEEVKEIEEGLIDFYILLEQYIVEQS